MATGAAAGRIFGNRHWLSDVVGGGMIGYGVAQLAEKYNPLDPEQQTFRLKPFQVAHGAGLEVDMRF